MKKYLNNAFLWCIWKISGRSKADFASSYNIHYFLTRSVFRAALGAFRSESR